MEWLNYHHLHYFWVVAREGSVTAASQLLFVSQPSVSEQIRCLERFAGGRLFAKSGRGLVLTELGESVYRYAAEIFETGNELVAMLRDRPIGRSLLLRVGVVDVLPKLIAHKLLLPALRIPERPRILCQEGSMERLLGEMTLHRLDVVLSEAPLPATLRFRAFSHPLGECGVVVVGTPELARRYKRDFPRSLAGAPFLLPSTLTVMRRSLDQWFQKNEIVVEPRGEFDDSSLLKTFGQAGEGLFCIPSAIEKEVREQFKVRVVGKIPEVRLKFYAISAERKLKHPATVAISEASSILADPLPGSY